MKYISYEEFSQKAREQGLFVLESELFDYAQRFYDEHSTNIIAHDKIPDDLDPKTVKDELHKYYSSRKPVSLL